MRLKYMLMNQEGGGSGGAGGAGGDAGGKGDGDGGTPPVIDPKDHEMLKNSIAVMQESISKLEANNKALLQEKADAKKAAEAAALEAAKKDGNVEAIEKSWSDKYSALESAGAEATKRYEGIIHDLTVGATSRMIASEMALPGSADVLIPHISQRLSVEIKDNKPVVKVLDKDGKPSAMTLKELQAEFEATPAFAPLLVGSKGSGSGYRGNGNWNGSDGMKIVTRSEFDSMNPAQKSAFSVEMRQGKAKIIDPKAA